MATSPPRNRPAASDATRAALPSPSIVSRPPTTSIHRGGPEAADVAPDGIAPAAPAIGAPIGEASPRLSRRRRLTARRSAPPASSKAERVLACASPESWSMPAASDSADPFRMGVYKSARPAGGAAEAASSARPTARWLDVDRYRSKATPLRSIATCRVPGSA